MTLEDLLKEVGPERRAKIEARAEEMIREITLAQMREELQMSQTELAVALGVKQPAVARMEKCGQRSASLHAKALCGGIRRRTLY